MDNKLNLMVNFMGHDKLSGSIKTIMMNGKSGGAALGMMKREAKKLNAELDALQREMGQVGVPTQAMINRQRELAAQVAKTNRQIDTQAQRLTTINKIERRAGKVSAAAGGAGAMLSVGVTGPLGAFGVQAFKAAMNAEELQSAFNVTFGSMSNSMNKWAESSGNAMGRSTREMQQAANTFGIFFNQAANPKKAAVMSQKFSELAQDLSSFYNTDTQTAIDKLRSGLSGESEPLRDFGVFMTEAAVKAKAMKLGLAGAGNELTEQEKIMARYAIILDNTKNAQGDVARTSNSTANKLRAQRAAWEELQITVGSKLLPALTPLIGRLANLIDKFNTASPATQKLILYAGLAAFALGPLLMGVAGLAAGIGFLAGPLSLMSGGLMIAGKAILFVGRAMLMNPIGLLVTALAVGAYLIYTHWGTIKGYFNQGLAFLQALPARMQAMGRNIINGLINGIVGSGARVGTALYNIIKSGVDRVKNFLGIKSPSRLFMSLGNFTSQGMAMGIDRGRGNAIRAAGRLASGVAAAGALSLAPAQAGTLQRGAMGQTDAGASGAVYNISITVNAGANADATSIADQVMRQLDQVAGIKARRSYDDGE